MLFHPFQCRLPEVSAFPQYNEGSLVATGFTSIALGILTAFRPTPILLLKIISELNSTQIDINFLHDNGPYMIYSWLILMFLALIVGGLTSACSRKIRKLGVLLIHPWALLILYFDAFFWLCITIYLHTVTYLNPSSIEGIKYPFIYFTFIYIDVILFIIIHWLFATYFITAQITVLENTYVLHPHT